LEMVEFAREAERLATPEPADAGERLVQHAEPGRDVRELDPRHAELGLGPSRAEARDQTPAGELVERGEAPRRDRRVAEEVAEDEVADANALGRLGDDRRLHHGV